MSVRKETQRVTTETGMHVCPSCSRPFVHPTDWSEAGPEHWNVELACPNCDWNGGGVFSDSAVERFDRELDRAAEEILADLEELSRSSMTEYVDRFVGALHAGQVLPEDF
ncbi:MAG: hypothetical protein QOG09_1399 [Solirubrobacterales bacterium]|jgi:hypothetical protein|nr:hypothetical protein [Solirubrobacterales bacterium]MDX6652167.1 hypothetical protein [Solirubrobacterales bacterium]MDX6663297.1 hypothetical protein [Solirubrobacterales bacterium]